MAATIMYVIVAGAGDKSGSSWANAMGLGEWETDVEGSAEAGDIYYVEEGTYALTGAWDTALDGISAEPIYIIGVKSGTSNEPPVFSDHAFTTARPIIACGANNFYFDDYWIIKNLEITGTATSATLKADTGSVIQNVKSNNTGAGGRIAIWNGGTAGRFIGCEAQSVNGIGITIPSSSLAFGCYVHDCTDGINFNGSSIIIVNMIVDTCADGINVIDRSTSVVIGCTIYNSTTIAIKGTTGSGCTFLNNILDGSAVGVDWTTVSKSNYFDYNCWDNTDDVADSDIVQGNSKVEGDPGMTNPGAGDFSIGTGSNCHNVALDAGDLTGATV